MTELIGVGGMVFVGAEVPGDQKYLKKIRNPIYNLIQKQLGRWLPPGAAAEAVLVSFCMGFLSFLMYFWSPTPTKIMPSTSIQTFTVVYS